MFFMKTVSLMWDYDNGFFPNCFNNYFLHTRTIRHHEARFDMNQTAFKMLPLMSLTKLEGIPKLIKKAMKLNLKGTLFKSH